jgi:DNA-binding response OmpR family regulator
MKILIIDDDPAMTDLLRLILHTSGAEIFVSNSGQEGLARVDEQNPDLIILDLMMPEIDGWSVCRQIRAKRATPILILSALNSPGVVASSLDAGADDYLVKPVPNTVLLAHIQNLLKRSSAVLMQEKSIAK